MNLAKALLSTAFILCSLLLRAPTAFAIQSASTSAAASDSATKSIIKEQVEKALKQQANDPQVKGISESLRNQKFGVVGTLEKIVGSSLQIRSVKGTLRLVDLDRGAVIIRDQRQIAKEDLELNVPVIVMGYKQSDGTLLARRVVISDETAFGVKKASLYGTATEITAKAIGVQTFVKDKNTPFSIKLSNRTQFLNSLSSLIKRSDIKANDPLIAVFSESEASSAASKIYSLSPKAIPTPSATLPTTQ